MSALNDPSLYVSDEIIERKVKLGRSKTEHAFYFRQLSQEDFQRLNGQKNSTPAIIAASLCEPDGTLALTPEKAATLKQGVVNALMAEILVVNDVGDAGND